MTNYYHYTNAQGLQGIKSAGYIRQSEKLDDGDDARFGKGVYLTNLPPTAGKKKIVETCWGRNQWPRFKSKVAYFIRVKLPSGKVKQATKNREVYLYKGDLYLDEYQWDSEEVPDKD